MWRENAELLFHAIYNYRHVDVLKLECEGVCSQTAAHDGREKLNVLSNLVITICFMRYWRGMLIVF